MVGSSSLQLETSTLVQDSASTETSNFLMVSISRLRERPATWRAAGAAHGRRRKSELRSDPRKHISRARSTASVDGARASPREEKCVRANHTHSESRPSRSIRSGVQDRSTRSASPLGHLTPRGAICRIVRCVVARARQTDLKVAARRANTTA
jgi:hypothetical protein